MSWRGPRIPGHSPRAPVLGDDVRNKRQGKADELLSGRLIYGCRVDTLVNALVLVKMSSRQLCRFLRRDLFDVLAPVFRASVHCEAGDQLFVMNWTLLAAPSSTRTLMLGNRAFLSSRKMILVSPTAWGVRTTVRSSCAVASTIFGFPIIMVLNGLSVVKVDINWASGQQLLPLPSARVADVATTKIAATNIPAHCGPSLATTSRPFRQT